MIPLNHPYLVHHFLENSAAKHPDKVALICGDQRLTYQQINHSADQLAAGLIDMGVKRQDRVIIFLDNSAEAVIALFGILKAGAIFVMLNPTMKAKKLNYILKDSGASALITHKTKTRIVTDAIKDAPQLEHIIWCTPHPAPDHPINQSSSQPINQFSHSWKEIFSDPPSFPASQLLPSALSPLPLANRSIDLDLATIIYTSGSTGEPKGVMSAHCNVVAAATSIATYLENVEDDIILSALPLSFDYGL